MTINKIKGSGGKIIPEFYETINNPNLTTNEKNIYNQKKFEKKDINVPQVPGGPNSYPQNQVPQTTPNIGTMAPIADKTQDKLLLDLQVYQDAKKPNPLLSKQANIPLPPLSLSSPFMPPQFQNYFNNFMKNFYTPFIYKDYNINIGGPNANHIVASIVYEDALPPAEVFSSYKSVKERNNLSDYIRSTFIKIDEGELVNFLGNENSLNSRLKLLELNPYNTDYYSNNPYKGLGEGFLIYRSCYPIVYDEKSSTTQCNKSSVGLNLRVYELLMDEIYSKYYNNKQIMKDLDLKKNKKFNTWYEILNLLQSFNIKDKINLEAKFGLLNITDPLIKNIWQKILNIIILPNYINNNKLLDQYNNYINNLEQSILIPENPDNFNVWREVKYYEFIRNKINKSFISPNFVQSYCYFINKNADITFKKNGNNTSNDKNILINNSNIISIILTESPNQNLYSWASNRYIKHNNILKLSYSGYKPTNCWESIFSQILIVFYIMDKFKFTFESMTLESNFYIKDINIFGDNKQYWKYVIDGIEYFIPNFGHLIMLDHNYKNLKDNKQYKIYSKELFNDDEDLIINKIKENAISCIDSNNFGPEFKDLYKGVPPDEKIKFWLDKVNTDLNNIKVLDKDNYKNLIEKYLIKYIHNRTGTLVRDTEIPYIRKNEIRPFKRGQLVIYEEKFDTYRILLFLRTKSELLAQCITKENEEYIFKEFNLDLLYHYSEYDILKQDNKPGEPFVSDDEVIEKYVL